MWMRAAGFDSLAHGPIVLLGTKQAMHEEDRRVLLVRHRLSRRVQVKSQGDGLNAC